MQHESNEIDREAEDLGSDGAPREPHSEGKRRLPDAVGEPEEEKEQDEDPELAPDDAEADTDELDRASP